ncbi:MAG: DUF2061 domain-containing protein [Pseudomonadales bacterium]|jgi:uncharacterized membrane protein|nr:DUF2061 domain-containing protein [Pseudomonadales bacterium]MDP7357480.1 DUF2061 domain-containing protein [Pseudomonadales bacterium]MDP7597356.1 DUF2061 domain-containing protein [Pseudomonadales bacterium]HJN51503.1 DUF2061 domain-containing protein [Pseudomonadales bacterium]|tara:strand:+ start:862 stop:1110 length:249 start_codon:yes stop_codon:yes gene_type:complete
MIKNIELRESHLRSVLKAFTWRILATLTTMLIALVVTGQVALAVAIGGIEFFVKFIIFYLHERAWQLIPRGSVRRWGRSAQC